MTPELTTQLEACKTLPSPPGVATKIISLANDPDVDIREIAQALAMDTHHDVGTSEDLTVTVSVGMATHCEKQGFDSVDSMVNAADKALYSAKLQGRNRSIPFDQLENLQVGQM